MHPDQQEREYPRSRRREREPRGVETAAESVADSLTSGEEPSVPGVRDVRALKRFASPPYHIGDVTVRSVTVTDGDPQHGALMSAAHVSGLKAQFPFECPECPAGRATFDYQRHHNIAGRESLTCDCGYTHFDREW